MRECSVTGSPLTASGARAQRHVFVLRVTAVAAPPSAYGAEPPARASLRRQEKRDLPLTPPQSRAIC